MTIKKAEKAYVFLLEKWQKCIQTAVNKFTGFENTLNNKSSINTAVIAVVCLISFGLMCLVNFATPFALDDFAYHYIFQESSSVLDGSDVSVIGERVSSVADIITSMQAHYKTTNGRVVIHFLVQLMILLGKPVFNVINSAVYVLTMLLIYKHCTGKSRKNNSAVLFLIICLSVWTFSPNWGMTTIWLDGSVNYLWGSAIRLAALLPFRLYADDGAQKHSLIKTPLIFIACAIAGATNENTSAAFIGMIFLFCVYYKIKKFKLPAWSVCGFFGALLGFAFMVLAPGNSKRIDVWSEENNSVLSRITNIPANAVLYLSVFAGAFVILSLILYTYKEKIKDYKTGIFFIYLVASVAGALVMIAVPYFPYRAWFGLKIMALIAVGGLLYQLKSAPAIFRQILLIGVVFWSVWASMSYAHMYRDASGVMAQYNERVEYIREQKELGNYDLTLPLIEAEDERSPLYGFADLGKDKNSWTNLTKAKYYGLNSITAKEPE